MTQTYSLFTSGVGGDTPATLVAHTNANGESLRSQFSGTSAPASPVEGQTFFNTTEKKGYVYVLTSPTEGYWRPDDNTEVTNEVVTARGSTTTLDTRLSIAINTDGTLKETLPITANKWILEDNTVTYVDSTHFTITSDVSSIYILDRAVKLTQTTSGTMYVVSSSYASGTDLTTVTIKTGTVDSGLTMVEYSTLVAENMPYSSVDTSTLANTSLSNLDETGEAKFTAKANTNLMNTNFITNGILSSPNGVATYSGLQLQLPAGTVLACPNGINANGTRKSIVVTTASLLTRTSTAVNGSRYKLFYIQSTNSIDRRIIGTTYYYEQPTTPTGMSNDALWYNNSPSVNKCYQYNGSTWDEFPFVVIADFIYTSGAISNFSAVYPIELVKKNDSNWIARQGKPSNNGRIGLTLGASGSNYVMPANGTLYFQKVASATGQVATMIVGNSFAINSTMATTRTPCCLTCFNLKADDIVQITYNLGGKTQDFKFIFDEGNFNV